MKLSKWLPEWQQSVLGASFEGLSDGLDFTSTRCSHSPQAGANLRKVAATVEVSATTVWWVWQLCHYSNLPLRNQKENRRLGPNSNRSPLHYRMVYDHLE